MPNINNRTFFSDVSARANYIDIDSVKKVYYAILKTIIDGLEKDEKIHLPDFGKFFLLLMEGRRSPGLKGGPVQYWPSIKLVKFKSCDKLMKYFKDRS